MQGVLASSFDESLQRLPQVRSTYKAVFWFVAVLVLIALAFPYVLPLFY